MSRDDDVIMVLSDEDDQQVSGSLSFFSHFDQAQEFRHSSQ